jgi:hypothetical protein
VLALIASEGFQKDLNYGSWGSRKLQLYYGNSAVIAEPPQRDRFYLILCYGKCNVEVSVEGMFVSIFSQYEPVGWREEFPLLNLWQS